MGKYRGADAVLQALSLTANSRDLSGLSALDNDSLWLLDARDLPVHDADLGPLVRFRRLEVLALDGTEITDRGLEVLRQLPLLRTVSLTGCGVTDEAARILGSIRTLQDLELDETGVTDSGLAAFDGHPELMILDLRRTPVKGEGLHYLANLPKLRELRLTGSARRSAKGTFAARSEVWIL